jgi:hypothetical protein
VPGAFTGWQAIWRHRSRWLCSRRYQKLVSNRWHRRHSWTCDARVADCLARGGTFHWFVSAVRDGAVCRSALASFEIR